MRASVRRAGATSADFTDARNDLRAELPRVVALGGEGLMLRRPASAFEVGSSVTLLKVKSFLDAEARVLQHLPGAGRHKGRLGDLLVEFADGTRFSVGTGFSDAERERPPAVGAPITFRYQELSDGGVPASHRSSPCGMTSPRPRGWGRSRPGPRPGQRRSWSRGRPADSS